MITLKVKTGGVPLPDHLKHLAKTVRPIVNRYIYANLDDPLRKAMKTLARTYIYQKLHKETGKIQKSMTPEKRLLNQYAATYGFYFDPRIAPHASTQIPSGDPGMVRIAGKGKQLAIPLTGGPADKKGKRYSPKSLKGNWYVFRGTNILCKEGDTTGYFALKPSVLIPQRVFGEQLAYDLNRELAPVINKLAAQALQGL